MGKRAKKMSFNKKIGASIAAAIVIPALIATFLLAGPKQDKKAPSISLSKSGQANKVDFDKPVRILVLGSDSRSGNIRGSRSDANMLVQLNPDHSANIVSFPRDSYVPIAGGGTGKINSAMALGGPERTVRTVENYTGLKIDYYMVTSFPGFTGVINAVGGLKFTFDKPLNDALANAHFSAGAKVLRGDEALAVARARHVAGGDFARQARQQEIAVAALKQERYRKSNLGMIMRLVSAFTKRVETDLSHAELFELIRAVLNVDPAKVDKSVLQGGTGSGGGASVVYVERSFANKAFAKMKAKE